MDGKYDQYWRTVESSRRLRSAIAVSIGLHFFFSVVFPVFLAHQRELVIPAAYEVQLIQGPPASGARKAAPPAPQPPKPVPPKPEPPKVEQAKKPEEPKPEPPKKEEPKPKPEAPKKKEEPKPKPEPPKKEEPKPQLAKNEPPPKPQPSKAVPEPSLEEALTPLPDMPKETGVAVQQEGLPSELSSWARLVQRKVEDYWVAPGGIRLDPAGNQAWVSFWVDREGRLLGEPQVVKHASDPELGESGVRAIKLAAPLPPLPEGFRQPEQEVVYVFTLVQ